jgi:hypothetical protein
MADVAQWPSFLPSPRVSGYGYKPKSNFASTDMDGGNTRFRRRYTKVPTTFTVVWRLNRTQLRIFEGFVEYDIDGGAAWFETPLYNGTGVQNVRAHFAAGDEPYSIAPVDSTVLWVDVSASLYVIDVPKSTQDEYEALKATGSESDLLRLARIYYEAINVVLPTGDESGVQD